MGNDILKLYPQFTRLTDRRQQSEPVDSERRSGEDRRQSQRIVDPELGDDLNKIQDTFQSFVHNTEQNKELEKAAFVALSPITPIRRISSLPDNVEDGNYSRAAGLVALAVVNLPEDTRDLKAAWKQISKGELPNYDYKEYQHPFSFLRGTLFEPLLGKMGKFGVWLCDQDLPLYDTKIGEWLEKIFKFELTDKQSIGRLAPWMIKDETGNAILVNWDIKAIKLSGNTLAKTIGRALLRIPKISALILLGLELPAVIKEISKPKDFKSKITNGTRQIIKSIINVVSILAGIGIGGAILAKKGPAGSLTGMGIGSLGGIYISKQMTKFIDKITNRKTI